MVTGNGRTSPLRIPSATNCVSSANCNVLELGLYEGSQILASFVTPPTLSATALVGLASFKNMHKVTV
jgi:hypothetical protein